MITLACSGESTKYGPFLIAWLRYLRSTALALWLRACRLQSRHCSLGSPRLCSECGSMQLAGFEVDRHLLCRLWSSNPVRTWFYGVYIVEMLRPSACVRAHQGAELALK